MLSLGVVALATTVQAATFRWYQGGAVATAGDNSTDLSSGTLYLFSGNSQSELLSGYVAALASDASSGVTYLTSAAGYVGSGALSSSTKFASTTVADATVQSGRVQWTETTADTSRSYYQVLVSGDNIYITDTLTTGVVGTGNTNFSFDNDESLAAIREASAGYQSGGWYSVPEPTSGLLMLLGMAGLALRRRRT